MKLYDLCKKTWALSLLVFVLLVSLTPVSQAAAFLSVAQALENQNNSVQTVKGYVVGQPTGTSTVITSNYPNDYALALADSANETNTDKMVYVQIPSNLRSTFGLQSHSELKGKNLTVTGTLTPYFSHPGIKSVTSISTETGGTDPAPDPTEPTVPVEDYYRTAAGKTGNTLKTELHNIIDHHTELSYSAVWEALKKTDEDPANVNNVILLYTGRSQAKSTNGGGVDDWNREHVWAKSHGDFGTAMGPGTDLHHLRPTDVSVNSTRGNLDFDNGGTEHSEALGNYFDSDSWEPRDEVKGDVARMLFYMAVRYEGDVSDEPDLELNNTVNNGTAPYHGKLSVLLQWNAQDPVDDRERRRNDIIYSDYQHNRNPFIDHPEWVNEIWN
ncbi:endonuclease [Priestia sp. YIM B13446]|uniref:endonuclease n=1 Tax=Priestia TaxID=2800373 RepID=UPI000BF33E74|nr:MULTISPECIES: endonuclease [Priestia]MBX9997414.1 endonuclease [Priestia aryabhattai]MCM3155238.1 endonuclease [Priestia megaterium]MCU7746293.1 endonuclease [Priestia megaterium]MEB2294170.1 endonuclease [Priestia megaterium]MED4061887.1 endonuclease [Priestia megaterium]